MVPVSGVRISEMVMRGYQCSGTGCGRRSGGYYKRHDQRRSVPPGLSKQHSDHVGNISRDARGPYGTDTTGRHLPP